MAKEARYTWTFTGNSSAGSSFVGQKHDLDGLGLEHAWYVSASAGCTATVNVMTARSTTATGVSVGSTSVAAGVTGRIQLTGPFLAVWPVAQVSSASTNSVIVDLIAIGGAL